METLRFDQIARECRSTHKGVYADIPIVGLEHIEPYEMFLHSYDVNVETTFTKTFKKGQMLFGRRRAYQHKACVATCDGICSGDITVIEPIEGMVDKDLFPFLIQNDDFIEHAIKGSNGALSPRVKWEHMANYEFSLPPLDEQKRLAEKLWAAYEVKQSYLGMINAIDEMVKAKFVEMFGQLHNCKEGVSIVKLSECCTYISDGSHYSPPESPEGIYPMLSVKDMTDTGFSYNDCKYIDQVEYDKLVSNGCKPLLGDVLVAKDGSYFKSAFCISEEKEQSILSSIAILRPNPKLISSQFLAYYMLTRDVIDIVEQNYLTGTAIRRVILKGFKEIPVLLPSLSEQSKFVDLLIQSQTSKTSRLTSISAIDKVIKSLINENL